MSRKPYVYELSNHFLDIFDKLVSNYGEKNGWNY